MQPSLTAPWLIADLLHPRSILSFAPHNPGFTTARHILMREVRDADLTPELDAGAWLAGQMQGIGHGDSVGLMTSRSLHHFQHRTVGPVQCLATVGLGNAERVGHRRGHQPASYGTINLVVLIDRGLTQSAMIEAMTIVAEARTLAVISARIALPQGLATGTGTDCIALACDPGQTAFAGLHTELGEAIGCAVHDAVLAGAQAWVKVHGPVPSAQVG